MTLQGAAGNLLSLRSSTPGSWWYLDPQGTRNVAYLDVQDSYNTNFYAIDARLTGSVDSGNNIKWMFVDPDPFTWLGDPLGVNDWNVASNWFWGIVPGTNDVAVYDPAVSIENSDINVSIDVDGVNIKGNYLGTITQLSGSAIDLSLIHI